MTIRLGQFWARRARRLLPALLVMLIGVAIYAKVFATPGEFAGLRLDSLSTLFYVANWHFIFGGGNYFNLTAQPSPLSHMWSLSIEEQFYIVWPPVAPAHAAARAAAATRRDACGRSWPPRWSAPSPRPSTCVLSYQHGASIMRLYEGTDTRCQDILVGAALAIGMAIWAQHRPALSGRPPVTGRSGGRTRRPAPPALSRPDPPPRPHRRRGPRSSPSRAWEITPAVARVCLQVARLVVPWASASSCGHSSPGPAPSCSRVATSSSPSGWPRSSSVVVTAQTASLSRALGNPVFRYVGKISYGTYLWHFPLFALLDARADPSLRLPAPGRPHRGHPGGGHRLLLSGGGADPPGQDAVVDRVEGVADDLRRLSAVVAVTVVATVPSTAEAAGTVRPVGAQYSGPPVKVAIFGDSVAWRLGFAMLASQPQNSLRREHRQWRHRGLRRCCAAPSTWPTACPTRSPRRATRRRRKSVQWPAQWQADLEPVPSQRGGGAGRPVGGRRPIDRRALAAHRRPGVRCRREGRRWSRRCRWAPRPGALMVFMTSPCFDSGEQDNGLPWPEDSASPTG